MMLLITHLYMYLYILSVLASECFFGELYQIYLGIRRSPTIGMPIYRHTILCSLTHSFGTLIINMFFTRFGRLSLAAMATMAILKNCYGGQKLMKMMATIIMVFMLAPIVAPIIGSLIVYTTGSWQDIFHFLTIY